MNESIIVQENCMQKRVISKMQKKYLEQSQRVQELEAALAVAEKELALGAETKYVEEAPVDSETQLLAHSLKVVAT